MVGVLPVPPRPLSPLRWRLWRKRNSVIDYKEATVTKNKLTVARVEGAQRMDRVGKGDWGEEGAGLQLRNA